MFSSTIALYTHSQFIISPHPLMKPRQKICIQTKYISTTNSSPPTTFSQQHLSSPRMPDIINIIPNSHINSNVNHNWPPFISFVLTIYSRDNNEACVASCASFHFVVMYCRVSCNDRCTSNPSPKRFSC